MLTRAARPLEIALGALFVVSAALKALNVYGFAVQVAAYGVVREPSITLAIAYTMIAIEAILGVALLGGMRFGGLTVACTGALLAGFTALIAYAWAFKGLADCGCFGDYVKMGPAESIAKNVVLMFMTAGVWLGTRTVPRPAPTEGGAAPEAPSRGATESRHTALAAAGVLAIAAAFAMGKPAPKIDTPPAPPGATDSAAAPFAKYVPDLGGAPVPLAQGEFFVAMLSASCDHCRAATQTLNELAQAPGVPQIAALMMGTQDEMDDFIAATDPQFPFQTIDTLEFMNLLGKATAPPCFYIVRDGKEVRDLIAEEPTYEQLFDFATKPGAAQPEAKQ
ncbi:MAG: hypothetical protein FJY92_00670 [Candidatus Hydrogenedentes bacterium]|nr:hypothetical protein [Candidatus Hydrogenedentota bacterium]